MYIFILHFAWFHCVFKIKLKFAIVFHNQLNRYFAISFLGEQQQQKLIFQFYTFASGINVFKNLIHFTQDKADGANTGKQMYEQNSSLFYMGSHYTSSLRKKAL